MSLISNDVDEIIQKLQSMDAAKLCRFCLSDDSNVSILQFNSETFDSISFFQNFLEISILETNGRLPSKMCKSCLIALSAAFKFREQCRKANTILNNVLISKSSTYDIQSHADQISHDVDAKNGFCFGKREIFKKHSENNDIEMQNDDNSIKSNHSDDENTTYNNIATLDETSEDKFNVHDLKPCPDSKPSICVVCNLDFANVTELQEHYKKLHKGEKRYKCNYCERTFSQRKPLQYHEKTHTGERPYVCDLCGKSYIQPNNLIIHKRNHTGEKPFVCKECGKRFTNGASLTLHMPVHTGVKNFVCTICGKGMARSGELTIHMRTHTGEKPYACSICSKAFIKKSSLQAHMFSHTGEKNFVCPICGHRVSQAGKLTIHIKTHSNSKPFSCPICNRQFATQGYLKQHSKIHSGDKSKPYVCLQCGRGFLKNRNLTIHMRTHTGDVKALVKIQPEIPNDNSQKTD